MNNDNMSDTEEMLQNLFSMGKKIYPIAESLRVKLNAIIAEQQVDAHAVSMALAYLAAGYVHQIKQMYDDPDTHDTIEDLFIGNFKAKVLPLSLKFFILSRLNYASIFISYF